MARTFRKKQQEETLWQVRDPWPGCGELAASLNVSPLVAQLLYNRGVGDAEQGRLFLRPTLKDLIEPERLAGIPAAVKTIRRALAENKKIVLYGDYDVDGITAIAILWQCLKLAGHEVGYYVPHRIEEGYGLNLEAVTTLAEQGAGLIVTVDCGVNARAAAAHAAKLGVEMVITDHHRLEGELAQAQAVVHPDLPGQDYPNKDLCGAGVAFKLAWALSQDFCGQGKVTEAFRDYLISATSLAALGTIADVVPLVGENRALACFGLQSLLNSKNAGIMALINVAGLANSKINSEDIGFKLAPRLNAAGRMGHARLAVELFTKCTEIRAVEIARYLEDQNRQRQKVEKEITEEAVRQILKLGMDSSQWRGYVISGENWHPGVIGIVASRIVDKYNRPTVIISEGQEKCTGSCRSVSGIDIHQVLTACQSHLIQFGGHAMAAGFSCHIDQVEPLRQAFNQYICEHYPLQELVHQVEIDAEATIGDLTMAAVQAIHRLGPFGAGNPPVLLVARQLRLVKPPLKMGGKGDHLSLTLTSRNGTGGMMRAVAFNMARWETKLQDAASFSLVFEPVINQYNGNSSVEMMVRDIRIDE